ncbi:MAG: DNA polymerase beta superfamily protein [Planctomycetales bacterium]
MLSVGTQVVALVEVQGPIGKVMHPRGAVGVIVHAPSAGDHSYRVRFPDGYESAMSRVELVPLAQYKQGVIWQPTDQSAPCHLLERVIYRCIVGSRAYGLDDDQSDTDRRGIYLPPGDLHWSLFGVPGQLESPATEEAYWELQKFLTLALKANPNVLECLYTPLVEDATPLARELLALREIFLSRVVYQTYNGYIMSQFKKLQTDLRNHGAVKWKHVMHMLRLLHSGITVLREGFVPVRVGAEREQLLAVKRGETAWTEIERWRLELHRQFDAALATTRLPERPDYERANSFLIKARRAACDGALP